MILTDFNSPRWKGVDMGSVSKCIDEIRSRPANTIIGELGHPPKFEVDLSNVTHVVSDIRLDEEKGHVEGEVRFLDNERGRMAKGLIESGACIMGIRAAGRVEPDGTIIITQVFSWDVIDPRQ